MHHHEFGRGGGEFRREEHREIRREDAGIREAEIIGAERAMLGGPGYMGPGPMMGPGAGIVAQERAFVAGEMAASAMNMNRPATTVVYSQQPGVMMSGGPPPGTVYAPGAAGPQYYPTGAGMGYPQGQYGQYPPGQYPPQGQYPPGQYPQQQYYPR